MRKQTVRWGTGLASSGSCDPVSREGQTNQLRGVLQLPTTYAR